jgi:hypothetical protein
MNSMSGHINTKYELLKDLIGEVVNGRIAFAQSCFDWYCLWADAVEANKVYAELGLEELGIKFNNPAFKAPRLIST